MVSLCLAAFHNDTERTFIKGPYHWVMEMEVYHRIRDLREDADLTQKEMAKLLNCSQQAYSNYELGQRDIPTNILIQLAKIHRTTTDYILGLTNTRDAPYPVKK